MRCILLSLAGSFLSIVALAQSPAPRYIEVVATDTVQLSLQGMDYEVAMMNPFDAATIAMSAGAEEEADFSKMLDDAEKKARASEKQFIELMKANSIPHRLSTTTHAEDYAFDSGKKMDVNSYLVELKDTAMMSRYQRVMEGTDFSGTVKNMRFSDATAANARLMSKLYTQARSKAQALATAAGGILGDMISAEEMRESEGSIFKQLVDMDRGRRSEGPNLSEGSTQSSSMVFRFTLHDK